MTAAETIQPVYKSVVVPVTADEAWQVFTERATQWWPRDHRAGDGKRDEIVFEPRPGGQYLERDVDGSVRVWGQILVWEPPRRLLMTWRVNGRWEAIPDDDAASEIEVTFTPRGRAGTGVTLGHLSLYRHGADAPAIRAALDGPSPGATLASYAEAVKAAA
jgi:uncharacterized protein YndB with AHSA1/START domain